MEQDGAVFHSPALLERELPFPECDSFFRRHNARSATGGLTAARRKPTMRTISSTHNQYRDDRAGLNSGDWLGWLQYQRSVFLTIVRRIVKPEA